MENATFDRKNTCTCIHHKFISILVIIFGLLFLLLNLNVLTEEFVSLAWPVIVIAGGGTEYYSSKCKCC